MQEKFRPHRGSAAGISRRGNPGKAGVARAVDLRHIKVLKTRRMTMPQPLASSQPAKNLRPCPALHGVIKPADCGAQRGSKLPCPEDCPFLPWGTAADELLSKVDAGVIRKSSRFVFDHVSKAQLDRWYRDGQNLYADLESPQILASGYVLWQALGHYRGAGGKTLLELWESQGWDGLNNDERIVLQCRRKTTLTVVETQRTIDPFTVVCVDLFQPEAGEFKVRNYDLASSTARFTRMLGWVVPLPFYRCLSPITFLVPSNAWSAWRTSVTGRFEEQRRTQPDLKLSEFLESNLLTCVQLIQTLIRAQQQMVMEELDFKLCMAYYQRKVPAADLAAKFSSRPEFEAKESPRLRSSLKTKAYYTWHARGESAAMLAELAPNATETTANTDHEIVGDLWLVDDYLVLQCVKQKKFRWARKHLDALLGSDVEFVREDLRDLTESQDRRDLASDIVSEAEKMVDMSEGGQPTQTEVAPVETAPPAEPVEDNAAAYEQRRQTAAKDHHQYYEKFLDLPHALLNQTTPRQASQNPELQTKLRELMKNHIHHTELRNRQETLNLSLDWVLDELKLADLKG
jgi:hypothetical protein